MLNKSKQWLQMHGPANLYLEKYNGYWAIVLLGHKRDTPSVMGIRNAIYVAHSVSCLSGNNTVKLAMAQPFIEVDDQYHLVVIFFAENQDVVLDAAMILASHAQLDLEIHEECAYE